MHFSAQAQKNLKKSPPRENFLSSRKMELSDFNIKKRLIFFQKEAFFIFRETETTENF